MFCITIICSLWFTTQWSGPEKWTALHVECESQLAQAVEQALSFASATAQAELKPAPPLIQNQRKLPKSPANKQPEQLLAPIASPGGYIQTAAAAAALQPMSPQMMGHTPWAMQATLVTCSRTEM